MAHFLVETYRAKCRYCRMKLLYFLDPTSKLEVGNFWVVALLQPAGDIPSIFTAICGAISRVALYRDLSELGKEQIWNQRLSFLVESPD